MRKHAAIAWRNYVASMDLQEIISACSPQGTFSAVLVLLGIIFGGLYLPAVQSAIELSNGVLPTLFTFLGAAASLTAWRAGVTKLDIIAVSQIIDTMAYSIVLLSLSAYTSGSASHAFAGLFALSCIFWGRHFSFSLIGSARILIVVLIFVVSGMIDVVSTIIAAVGVVLFIIATITTKSRLRQKAVVGLAQDALKDLDSILDRHDSDHATNTDDHVAALVHDLKNTLIPLSWSLESFAKGRRSGLRNPKESLTTAVESINGAVSILADYLKRAKRSAIGKDGNSTVFLPSLGEAVQNSRHVEKYADKNLIVQIDEVYVKGQLDFLKAAVNNLVENAFDAGADTVALRTIETNSEQQVALELTDNGPGLTKGVQKKLFEPFNAGGKEHGVGLGIYLAYRMVKSLGGEIKLAHSGKDGTKFVLTLPKSENPSQTNI